MIRQAIREDAVHLANVHLQSWRTTYRGILEDEYLDSLSYEEKERLWRNVLQSPTGLKNTFVAYNQDNEIIGFINGGQDRDKKNAKIAEIYAFYLVEEYQKQGIGTQLYLAIWDHFKKNQYSEMTVWVIQNNPSIQFYLKKGGIVVEMEKVQIGNSEVVECKVEWFLK